MRYKLIYGLANCYYAGVGVYFWDNVNNPGMAWLIVLVWGLLMLIFLAGYISLD